MNGLLIIDKPLGPTSHDVVARVRRVLRTPRVGHTGTLDPLATGVLPLVIGSATRLASLLTGADKEYLATIRLGLATETYDSAGREGPPPAPMGIDADAIEETLNQFRGTFQQMPPPFSAKKIGGVPAYKLARRREPVQPSAVMVTVDRLSLEDYAEGLVRVRMTSSAGFYVRSLAHDLGQRLGCGAYLETLRRIRVGGYTVESAHRVEDLEGPAAGAARLVIPMEELLPEIPAVVLNERALKRATHGNEIQLEDVTIRGTADATRYRLLDGEGRLVAVAETRPGGLLHPVTVLV